MPERSVHRGRIPVLERVARAGVPCASSRSDQHRIDGTPQLRPAAEADDEVRPVPSDPQEPGEQRPQRSWGGAPSGTIIQFAANGALTEASDLRVGPDGRYCFTTSHASAPGLVASCVAHAGIDASWVPGSRHKLVGCISPIDHVLKLYVDGSATSAIPATVAGIPQLNDASGRVTIGPSLVGGNAVIYRGFICTDPSQRT